MFHITGKKSTLHFSQITGEVFTEPFGVLPYFKSCLFQILGDILAWCKQECSPDFLRNFSINSGRNFKGRSIRNIPPWFIFWKKKITKFQKKFNQIAILVIIKFQLFDKLYFGRSSRRNSNQILGEILLLGLDEYCKELQTNFGRILYGNIFSQIWKRKSILIFNIFHQKFGSRFLPIFGRWWYFEMNFQQDP